MNSFDVELRALVQKWIDLGERVEDMLSALKYEIETVSNTVGQKTVAK